MKHSEADYSVFCCHMLPRKCIYLIMYVGDIVIIGDDATRTS